MQDALWVRIPILSRDPEFTDDEELQAAAAHYMEAIVSRAELERPGAYNLGAPTTWAPSQFRLELADALSKIPPVAEGAVELAELILRRIDDAQSNEAGPAVAEEGPAPSGLLTVLNSDEQPIFNALDARSAARVIDLMDPGTLCAQEADGTAWGRAEGKWEEL